MKRIILVFLLAMHPLISQAEFSQTEKAYTYVLCFNLGYRAAQSFFIEFDRAPESFSEEFVDIFAEAAIKEAKRSVPNINAAVNEIMSKNYAAKTVLGLVKKSYELIA